MLTREGIAAVFAVLVAAQPASATPTRVTYLMEDPSFALTCIEGNLTSGAFLETKPQRGAAGVRDGACVRGFAVPVTRTWTVPFAKLRELRRLADIVWQGKVQGMTPDPDTGPESVILCAARMQTGGSLSLYDGSEKRAWGFKTNCVYPDGTAFLDGLMPGR